MGDYTPRTVLLAPGRAEGFGQRGAAATWMLGGFLAVAAVVVAITQSWVGFAVAAVVAGTAAAVLTPFELLGGATLGQRWMLAWRWRRRVRRGLVTFIPGETAVSRRGKATTGARVVPDVLGQVRVVDVEVSTGRGSGQVCVLLHKPAAGLRYATVVLEVENAGGGVQSGADVDAEYARFGRAKAALARRDSFVRSIQQVERVQPPSAAAHENWLATKVPVHGVPQVLVDSYWNLLTTLSWSAETHRTLLVLRMPFTLAWTNRVAADFGAATDAAHAQLAVREASRAATLLVTEGGYRRCQPLDQPQLAAAIRACLSDEHSWSDTTTDAGAPLDLTTCWLPWHTTDRSLQVSTASAIPPASDGAIPTESPAGQGRFLRTLQVSGTGLPGGPVPVTMLRRIVVGIYPAVVRTMSITEELTPASEARKRARSDATQGHASARNAGVVSDGSAMETLTAAQVRLVDLSPTSGHHGDGWSMHLTVSATSASELGRVCDRLEGVCGDAALPIRWLDKEQDLAIANTLPLGRGLHYTTKKVKLS